MITDKDVRIAELTHQRDALAAAIATASKRIGIYSGEVPLTGPQVIMAGEVERLRKLAALWKRLHWAVTENEFRSGSMESGDIADECEAALHEIGEDPKHAAGDPGASMRMAYAPQAGGGQEGE